MAGEDGSRARRSRRAISLPPVRTGGSSTGARRGASRAHPPKEAACALFEIWRLKIGKRRDVRLGKHRIGLQRPQGVFSAAPPDAFAAAEHALGKFVPVLEARAARHCDWRAGLRGLVRDQPDIGVTLVVTAGTASGPVESNAPNDTVIKPAKPGSAFRSSIPQGLAARLRSSPTGCVRSSAGICAGLPSMTGLQISMPSSPRLLAQMSGCGGC